MEEKVCKEWIRKGVHKNDVKAEAKSIYRLSWLLKNANENFVVETTNVMYRRVFGTLSLVATVPLLKAVSTNKTNFWERY